MPGVASRWQHGQVRIRLLTAEDEPGVRVFWGVVAAESPGAWSSTATELEANWDAMWASLQPPVSTLISDARGLIVGMVCVQLKTDDAVQRFGLVTNLAVHPDRRGEGLGRALLRAAHEITKAAGVSLVALHVASTQLAAIELYLSEGYRFLEGAESTMFVDLTAPKAPPSAIRGPASGSDESTAVQRTAPFTT